MHGLTGGSWKRHTARTRATEMKDTRGNLAVTSGSETYRRCALPRQLSTLLRRRCGAHPTDPSRAPTLTNVTVPLAPTPADLQPISVASDSKQRATSTPLGWHYDWFR